MHISIDYRITEFDPKARKNILTEPEQNAEAGRLRAKHLGGICTLLKLIDIRRENMDPTHEDIDQVSRGIHAVGELGEYLADSLYCNVAELGDEIEQITTFTTTQEEII